MRAFADLYVALDSTNKTNEKVAVMADFFRAADPHDAAWAVAFLVGRRPKRPVNTTRLATWAIEMAGLPEWLFGECYDAVGDLSETIARLLPAPEPGAENRAGLAEWVEGRLLPLAGLDDNEQRERVLDAWRHLDSDERFVWNKLITGQFRMGVSGELVVRALAQVTGAAAPTVAHRLTGEWTPSAAFFRSLFEETGDADLSKPYPFCLAYPLESDPAALGDPADWLAEWKWDGIRSQLIRRGGEVFLWSRGEDLITDRFPEIVAAGAALPEGVAIDGEVMAWRGDAPLPFADLQRRIGRKNLSKKMLEEVPAALICYDLLEHEGTDIRELPMAERRARLEALLRDLAPAHETPTLDLSADELHARQPGLPIQLSPRVPGTSWEELAAHRAQCRENGVEGLMLKRLDSPYGVGRRKGMWWKWKVEPFTVDAVLIYAQRGSGKRASLYTDYTFAVWDGDALVPFAKAYSGLTDAEIAEVDRFVRANTLEKFGPVRTVRAAQVFELAFEGIALSSRHKSGVAVRFPRILRWRKDKRIEDADRLETIRELIRDRGQ